MIDVYFVIPSGATDEARWTYFASRARNVLISAEQFRTEKGGFKPKPHLSTVPEKLIMDSGAYSILTRLGKWPFTAKEYVEFLAEQKPRFAVTMDYPCDRPRNESGAGRGDKGVSEIIGWSNKEKIEKTVENTRLFISELEKQGVIDYVQPMASIQGFYTDEFIYCIDLLKEQGLLTAYMGVGGICLRSDISSSLDVMTAIRKEIGPYAKLHAFGLSARSIKDARSHVFDSLDTMDWACETFYRARINFFSHMSGRLISVYPTDRVGQAEKLDINLRAWVEWSDWMNFTFHGKPPKEATVRNVRIGKRLIDPSEFGIGDGSGAVYRRPDRKMDKEDFDVAKLECRRGMLMMPIEVITGKQGYDKKQKDVGDSPLLSSEEEVPVAEVETESIVEESTIENVDWEDWD